MTTKIEKRAKIEAARSVARFPVGRWVRVIATGERGRLAESRAEPEWPEARYRMITGSDWDGGRWLGEHELEAIDRG